MANPFISGVNPPDTASIGGGISQMGALSGQLNSRRIEPLISARGGEIARVTFGSGLVYDPFNVWVDAGAPQAGGLLTGAGVRESIVPAGPPTGYIRIPGGSPFHFTGDFSAAFVFRMNPTAGKVIYQDGTFNVAGYLVTCGNRSVSFYQNGTAVNALRNDSTIGAVGDICVVCVGVAGATTMLKANLRTLVSGPGIAYVPATGDLAIGNTAAAGNNYFDSDIFEAWVSTQTPSDALFTQIMTEVHNKLGIATW